MSGFNLATACCPLLRLDISPDAAIEQDEIMNHNPSQVVAGIENTLLQGRKKTGVA